MAVSNQIPRNVSTAAPGATVFPFDFKILDAADLKVQVGTSVKTRDTDYTVSGVALEAGGTVTFLAPLVGGEVVSLRRQTRVLRLNDFQNLGDLLSATLNNDQDAPVMMIQDLAAYVLQLVEDGAGGLVWDAKGNRIINVGNAVLGGDAVNLQTFLQQIGEYGASGLNTAPKFWRLEDGGVVDGTNATFFIPGADITGPAFYTFCVNGVMIEPTDGFTIQIAPDTTGSTVTFTVPPAAAANCWGVLWGYAKPLSTDMLTFLMNDATFLAFLAALITNTLYETTTVLQLGPLRYLIPLADITGTTATIDGTRESYLLRATNAAAVTATVRANTGSGTLDWDVNPLGAVYFSIRQVGAGQVTLVPDTGVTLSAPAGYLAKTRAIGSIISVTLDSPATQTWTLSGDLAIDPVFVPGNVLVRQVVTAHVNSTTTSTVVLDAPAGTPMTATVVAGRTYKINMLGTYQTAATTTGCIIGLSGAGGVVGTLVGRASGSISASAVATELAIPLTTLSGAGSTLTTTGVSVINTPHWVELSAVFTCTTSGTVSLVFGSEVAASAAQLNAGSYFEVTEVVIA